MWSRWAWKPTPVILLPRRMRQEDSHKFERLCSEFKDSLSSKSDPVWKNKKAKQYYHRHQQPKTNTQRGSCLHGAFPKVIVVKNDSNTPKVYPLLPPLYLHNVCVRCFEAATHTLLSLSSLESHSLVWLWCHTSDDPCMCSSSPDSLLSLHCVSGCLSPTSALAIQRHFTLVPYCIDSMKPLIIHNVYV